MIENTHIYLKNIQINIFCHNTGLFHVTLNQLHSFFFFLNVKSMVCICIFLKASFPKVSQHNDFAKMVERASHLKLSLHLLPYFHKNKWRNGVRAVFSIFSHEVTCNWRFSRSARTIPRANPTSAWSDMSSVPHSQQ